MKISRPATDALVASFGKFIEAAVTECKNKHPSSLDAEELFEEGVVGLLKAANESGSWSEFAGRVEAKIRNEIEAAIIVEAHFAKLNQEIQEDFAEYRKVRAMLFQKLHRSPTLDEIAAKTSLPHEKLEGLENLYKAALDYE